MKGMLLNVKIKKALHDRQCMDTALTNVNETCTWNEGHRSRTQAVAMAYFTVVCGLNRIFLH